MSASLNLLAVEFYEVSQLIIVLLPVFLFAIYKTVSKILKHRHALMLLDKGIVPQPQPGPTKPRWIRSLYIGIFLLLISSPFLVYFIKNFVMHESIEFPEYLFSVIPFAAGIAYIIRALLKRKDYIRTLALEHGVPFEEVYTSRSWIVALALGIPLLGYAVVMILLCYFFGYADLQWTWPYTYEHLWVPGVFGGIFTLYGLLAACVTRKKASPRTKPEPNNVQLTYDEQSAEPVGV